MLRCKKWAIGDRKPNQFSNERSARNLAWKLSATFLFSPFYVKESLARRKKSAYRDSALCEPIFKVKAILGLSLNEENSGTILGFLVLRDP